jgi:hypothetical protein
VHDRRVGRLDDDGRAESANRCDDVAIRSRNDGRGDPDAGGPEKVRGLVDIKPDRAA